MPGTVLVDILATCSDSDNVDTHSYSIENSMFSINTTISELSLAQVSLLHQPIKKRDTVNWEMFARVLYSQNFTYAKFCENKILAKWRNYSIVY